LVEKWKITPIESFKKIKFRQPSNFQVFGEFDQNIMFSLMVKVLG
jgi:hypothetical protein